MDREKVINCLRELHGSQETMKIVSDAVALLKEQEAVEPLKQLEQAEWTVCGNCYEHLIHKWTFCPYCGRAVKWE